jgi:hypothetical protein
MAEGGLQIRSYLGSGLQIPNSAIDFRLAPSLSDLKQG